MIKIIKESFEDQFEFVKKHGNYYFTTYNVYRKDSNELIGLIEIHDRGVKKPYYVGWYFDNDFDKANGRGTTKSFDDKEDALKYIVYGSSDAYFEPDEYDPVRESAKRTSSKRRMTESRKDDVDYHIGVLNSMYDLNDETELKFARDSAYNKHRLVLEKNSTGAVYSISEYVTIGELYDIIDAIENVKNRLG